MTLYAPLKRSISVLVLLCAMLGLFIALPNSSGSGLVFAQEANAATNWNITTIDDTGQTGIEHSLALDPGGQPHVSYYDHTTKDLRYASLINGQWQMETVDSAGTTGRHNALAIDYAGTPHISYIDYDMDTIRYATRNASGWSRSTVAQKQYYVTDIAVDSAKTPHILYKIDDTYRIMHAVPLGQTWFPHEVDWVIDWVDEVTILINSQDQLSVSYVREDFDTDTHTYDWWSRYLIPVNNDWESPWGGFQSRHTDHVLGGQNQVQLSYTYVDQLKYAWLRDNAWSHDTVDSTARVINDTGLALDSEGNPHIAYIDANSNLLRYASWDGSQWQIQTVGPATAQEDAPVCLEIGADDQPHITFYDYSDRRLKYAAQNPQGELFFIPLVLRQ